MAESRVCSKCKAEEADGAAFPKLGTLCKSCDAARKAAWYRRKQQERGRSFCCVVCGGPLPPGHSKYCDAHRAGVVRTEAKRVSRAPREKRAPKPLRPQRACLDCGVALVARRTKYCDAHKEEHHRAATRRAAKKQYWQRRGEVSPQPVCAVCGTAIDRPRKYCSEECEKRQRAAEERARRAKKAGKPVPPATLQHVCEGCGVSFVSNRTRKFCDICTKDRALKQRLWEAKSRERDLEGYLSSRNNKAHRYRERHPDAVKEY